MRVLWLHSYEENHEKLNRHYLGFSADIYAPDQSLPKAGRAQASVFVFSCCGVLYDLLALVSMSHASFFCSATSACHHIQNVLSSALVCSVAEPTSEFHHAMPVLHHSMCFCRFLGWSSIRCVGVLHSHGTRSYDVLGMHRPRHS